MSTRAPVRPVVPPSKHERRRRVRPGRPARPARAAPQMSRKLMLCILAGVVVLAGAAAWLVLFSSVLGVRTVDVTGTRGDTSAAVRDIAAIPEGQPLARLDTDAITDRLMALPQVESVSVQRSWPSTVRIAVVERTPVALVDLDGAQWLIDSHGVLFAQVTTPPPGIPLLEVERASAQDRATLAAVQVIGVLPADVRERLARVSAATPDSVVLHMVGGRTVIWGSAENSERKAIVLAGVFSQPGGTLDVSSPEAVVIR